MTLKEFIEKYDYPGSLVLLEGKRNVDEEDKEQLIALGKLLSTLTHHMNFRSGNADGADLYFSMGVVPKSRLQVITPYSGHRKKTNQAYDTISLDDISLANEPEVVYQSKKNKATEKLIEPFVAGNKNRNVIKAAYIIRDTVKVIGTGNIKPATAGIFYDDLKKPRTGGTGHTMNVCTDNNVPVFDQTIWFRWLQEN